eukprot:7038701-Ditylum_brightwellii.AAC.1
MPPVESGALPPKKRATPPSNGTPFWENVEHASSSNEGTAIRTDGNLNASLDLNHECATHSNAMLRFDIGGEEVMQPHKSFGYHPKIK